VNHKRLDDCIIYSTFLSPLSSFLVSVAEYSFDYDGGQWDMAGRRLLFAVQ